MQDFIECNVCGRVVERFGARYGALYPFICDECFSGLDGEINWIVLTEEPNIHTVDHPFCDDFTCPCHHDEKSWIELLIRPYMDGLLTMEEYRLLWRGAMVGGKQ